jgi:hypothetical protein
MEGVTARIVAHPGPTISLAVELANDGDADWAGTVFEPIVPWDLRAWVDGEEVRVSQPALDIGVRPRPVRLAPGERTELPSPIVLVFEGTKKPDSPFIWTLKTPPADAVDLAATIAAGGAKLSAPRTTVRMP